jgi:hypothetical protein
MIELYSKARNRLKSHSDSQILELMEMWSFRQIMQFFWHTAILVVGCTIPAFAQESQQSAPQQATQTHQQAPQKPPQPYGGGTPLDVILNTRLWTDVPEAKEFVKATRPPEDTLEYQPTVGQDVSRPKPRTPAELKAMEDELERAGATAERAAGVRKRNFHVEAKKTKLTATTKPMELSPLLSRREHSQN